MNDRPQDVMASDHAVRPFFSIIMPVYNAAVFLRESLESITSQTFRDWEAILVDDASTDSSMAIAEEYRSKDPRIRVFGSSRNSGGAYTPRMKAADLAEGRYLVTIDADDKVAPDYLQTVFERIMSTDADIALTEMWRLTDSGSTRILPDEAIDTSAIWRGEDLVELTLCKWRISMNGFAIRRNIYIDAASRISEKDKDSMFADELLSRWLLFICSTAVFCKTAYYYRHNEESVTNINIPRTINNALQTSDGLIEMTASAFGENSPIQTAALDNKMRMAIGLLRIINSSKVKGNDKRTATKKVADAMRGFDYDRLKGRMSPRYLALMRFPIPAARFALKILDPIIKFKNSF